MFAPMYCKISDTSTWQVGQDWSVRNLAIQRQVFPYGKLANVQQFEFPWTFLFLSC